MQNNREITNKKQTSIQRIQKELQTAKSICCSKNDTNTKQDACYIKRDIVRFVCCIKSTGYSIKFPCTYHLDKSMQINS